MIVDGANMAKRHTKPRGTTMQGGIIDKDMPLPVSAVAIVCPACGPDPDRHAVRRDGPQGPRLPQVRGGPVMATAATRSRPRLKERYDDEVRRQLQQTLGLGNIMQVPRLEKIVINMGVGKATQQPSLIEGAVARP